MVAINPAQRRHSITTTDLIRVRCEVFRRSEFERARQHVLKPAVKRCRAETGWIADEDAAGVVRVVGGNVVDFGALA